MNATSRSSAPSSLGHADDPGRAAGDHARASRSARSSSVVRASTTPPARLSPSVASRRAPPEATSRRAPQRVGLQVGAERDAGDGLRAAEDERRRRRSCPGARSAMASPTSSAANRSTRAARRRRAAGHRRAPRLRCPPTRRVAARLQARSVRFGSGHADRRDQVPRGGAHAAVGCLVLVCHHRAQIGVESRPPVGREAARRVTSGPKFSMKKSASPSLVSDS